MKIKQLGYLIREGIRGVFSHGFRSVASITVIAACLIIMGSFALVAVNVDSFIGNLEDESQVLAFVDEALSEVTLDISGRPWLEWHGDEYLPPVIAREEKDVWREFYKALASAARMNVHVAFLYGKNGHHLLESAAKGLGLALAAAVKREGTQVRSTKGGLD